MDADHKAAWIEHWISTSFGAIEQMIERYGDGFAFGADPSLADCCLLPQIYSARRFKVPLGRFPCITAVEHRMLALDAVISATPERQTDAVSDT